MAPKKKSRKRLGELTESVARLFSVNPILIYKNLFSLSQHSSDTLGTPSKKRKEKKIRKTEEEFFDDDRSSSFDDDILIESSGGSQLRRKMRKIPRPQKKSSM